MDRHYIDTVGKKHCNSGVEQAEPQDTGATLVSYQLNHLKL
jgi:hypothetical protein